MKVLISGRSAPALSAIHGQIATREAYEVESVIMINGCADPLMSVDYRPDVVVLHAGEGIGESLRALAGRPAHDRPALVVVGDHLPGDATKFAMRAGARDIVGEQDAAELNESLERLAAEVGGGEQSPRAQVTVVVNAKGGSGATFIATSLGLLSATAGGHDTVLVDLDFQYGSLPHYLDVVPKRGLLEAMAHAHELDATAVGAYAVEHDSGLHVMAPIPDSQLQVDFDMVAHMTALIEVLGARYDRIVVDLPRHLDELAGRVLAQADAVLIVVQQSLLSVRDAVRLKTLLTRDLGIPEARVSCVINRFSNNARLEMADIRQALGEDDIPVIPNHYKLVSQALDMGVSVIEQAPGSAVAKGLSSLHAQVMGRQKPQSRGLFAAMLRLRG